MSTSPSPAPRTACSGIDRLALARTSKTKNAALNLPFIESLLVENSRKNTIRAGRLTPATSEDGLACNSLFKRSAKDEQRLVDLLIGCDQRHEHAHHVRIQARLQQQQPPAAGFIDHALGQFGRWFL